jgi:hypothetical protein
MGKIQLFIGGMRCKVCGRKFDEDTTTSNNPRKYCSRKCSSKSYYKKHKKYIITRAKLWQQKNPEKAKIIQKEAMLKYRTEKKEQFNASVMRNYQKNKNKWHARTTAHNKIKINPEQKCEWCNSDEKIQRHHPDYNKPTEIIFLCEKCHKNHHKQERDRLLVECKEHPPKPQIRGN